jgi:hypothetical protein
VCVCVMAAHFVSSFSYRSENMFNRIGRMHLDSFQYPIRENGLGCHTVAMGFIGQFSNCSLQLLLVSEYYRM